LLGRRDDVNGLLSQYDLFVHPSKWEGHSLAILEAAAAGLPAIISDTVVSGVDPHIVKVTFSADDAISLQRSIKSAILDLEEYQRRAANLAPSIREEYSLRKCALRYLGLCEAVTGRA
jgi:glycosyltransferase involved in cell wall biosynthesis